MIKGIVINNILMSNHLDGDTVDVYNLEEVKNQSKKDYDEIIELGVHQDDNLVGYIKMLDGFVQVYDWEVEEI